MKIYHRPKLEAPICVHLTREELEKVVSTDAYNWSLVMIQVRDALREAKGRGKFE